MDPKRENPLGQEDTVSRYLDSLSPAQLKEFFSEEYGLDGLPDVPDTFTLEEVEAGLAACGLDSKAPE